MEKKIRNLQDMESDNEGSEINNCARCGIKIASYRLDSSSVVQTILTLFNKSFCEGCQDITSIERVYGRRRL